MEKPLPCTPEERSDNLCEEETEQNSGTEEERAPGSAPPTSAEFVQSFRYTRLIDPKEPWVLVDNGSFLGNFDWVPEKFRVGPWCLSAVCILTCLVYIAALSSAFLLSEVSQPLWSTDFSTELEYPSPFTYKWSYNVLVSLWMMYIMYLVVVGPLSYRAWATYTIQSWTSLCARHVLCALAPFSSEALEWAEFSRFPVACSSTCTFVIWNAVIFPYAYLIGLKTEEQKKRFFQFAFSFRLVQIHFFNIVFCVLNILWASPPRSLEWVDFALAFSLAIVYILWYLMLMDRLGVHFYPVFTPRVWWIVIPMWSFLVLAYLGTFFLWKHLLDSEILK